ncbi:MULTISPECIES: hypothetical protein [Bacillaceae]|uniref:DUF2007 domain-containing protein n=1 Tax=Peribacillus simplex TaxID=1478 RepID=A0A109MYH0_9BACI|nr:MULTISPECIES: hypothetical protein [Bacillaceae]KWW20116.1 hypothetical protein AS888_06805 [Peribacillus simplex]PJN88043.1 hypothetical protein CVN76_23010 [Bacillus sp. mrc49]
MKYIIIGTLILVVACVVMAKLITYKYWTCIYTAFGHDNYFKVIAKLEREGVGFKTKTPLQLGSTDFQNRNKMTQYDVFVKKGDEQAAQRAIHSA